MKIRIRIQGALVAVGILGALLISKFSFPHWRKSPFDSLFDILGVVLVLSGYLFRVAARGYKEENTSGGNKLVKDGPYALMRNPMYFGTMLIGTGIICILFAFWAAPVFLIVYSLIYIPQVKKEESVLFKRFGKEYSDYSRLVPRYWPRVASLFNLRECVSVKLSWIKKEVSSLIIVLIVILAIESWEDIGLFGYKKFLQELQELLLLIAAFILAVIVFRKKENRVP